MKRLLYKTIAIASILSLVACGSGHSVNQGFQNQEPTTVRFSGNTKTPEQFLLMAASAPSPQQEQYQLMAVEKLIAQNKLSRAQQILATINTYNLPNNITVKKQLLFAKAQLADQKPDLALRALNDVPITNNMNKTDQLQLHQSLATSYERTGNIVAAIEQRNLLDLLLTEKNAKSNNQLKIWESVQHLPAKQITRLLADPLSPDIRGWLELAQVAQQTNVHSDQLLQQLANWRQNFPHHSGNTILPTTISRETRALTQQPHNLYLLVPLHGHHAKAGIAVRNGFMAAFYDTPQHKKSATTVNIIDTSQGDINNHYQSAISKGADFIIGPLTRANIKKLGETKNLQVPTLVLSYVEGLNTPNLYQLGSSQIDEATQAAQKAGNAGYHRAIVIAPQSDWGQNIAQRFKSTWQQQGNAVVDSLAYANSNDLSKPIRDLLHVNRSEQRARNLQKVLHEHVRYVPNRRDDVDMIFLVAMPQQARSIRPMLKFYYAGDIPVYATSLIYDPAISNQKNRDLDEVHFADIPWVIGGLDDRLQHIQDKTKKLWAKSFRKHMKFYGLGVDAHELIMSLSPLAIFPHYGIRGATGTLYLQNDHHVYHKLKWAQMVDGQPKDMDHT